jgi:acetylornithine deacetylase
MFHVPAPTLNLGRVHGGDSPNRICGHCYLDIDLRLLPGMEIEVIRHSMQERLQQCLHGSGLKLDFSSLFHGIPAMETRANSELVKLTETLTGHRAEAVAFATEGPYLQSLGMDVVIMGPGRIELAHQPDEYLEISTIEPTIALLQQLIYKHCVVGH